MHWDTGAEMGMPLNHFDSLAYEERVSCWAIGTTFITDLKLVLVNCSDVLSLNNYFWHLSPWYSQMIFFFWQSRSIWKSQYSLSWQCRSQKWGESVLANGMTRLHCSGSVITQLHSAPELISNELNWKRSWCCLFKMVKLICKWRSMLFVTVPTVQSVCFTEWASVCTTLWLKLWLFEGHLPFEPPGFHFSF